MAIDWNDKFLFFKKSPHLYEKLLSNSLLFICSCFYIPGKSELRRQELDIELRSLSESTQKQWVFLAYEVYGGSVRYRTVIRNLHSF